LNPQLIDAASDAHLWTERFNGDTSYLFTLQDEITSRIAAALNLELIGAEAGPPNRARRCSLLMLRALAAVSNPRSRGTCAEAIRLYERAFALDPRSVAAQSWLAVTLGSRVINQLTDTDAADIARAEGLVEQALAVSPRSTTAHFARGEVLWAQRRYSEGIHEHETMLAFDRSSVSAFVALDHCKLKLGPLKK
jgi:tetratricopeptide (TPR) repeat protein